MFQPSYLIIMKPLNIAFSYRLAYRLECVLKSLMCTYHVYTVFLSFFIPHFPPQTPRERLLRSYFALNKRPNFTHPDPDTNTGSHATSVFAPSNQLFACVLVLFWTLGVCVVQLVMWPGPCVTVIHLLWHICRSRSFLFSLFCLAVSVFILSACIACALCIGRCFQRLRVFLVFYLWVFSCCVLLPYEVHHTSQHNLCFLTPHC